MDDYIQISKLNDYIFCKYSLFFHGLYDAFSKDIYQDVPQTAGTIKHENIENREYSTSKYILQGIPVVSEKYKLIGKIDLYDNKNKILIERKRLVKKVYDGYKYQLYGEYFGLIEGRYEVYSLYIHSLATNKRFLVKIPQVSDLRAFEELINEMRTIKIEEIHETIVKEKCDNCIYSELCTFKLC
jgi:CRISPR-associated protein Cas4